MTADCNTSPRPMDESSSQHSPSRGWQVLAKGVRLGIIREVAHDDYVPDREVAQRMEAVRLLVADCVCRGGVPLGHIGP